MTEEKKIPLGYVFLWIFLSILLLLGTCLMGWLYYLHARNLRLNDYQYHIVAIIQKNSQNEPLKTMYLAELLDLSLDRPTNLYKFDENEGRKKLIASPLIKRAEIKKIRPGTLYIDYQTRIPMAYLGNYSNTAIDQSGYLFPFRPFFTPKALPTIYLSGRDLDIKWGMSLGVDKEFQLALKVLGKLESLGQNFLINRIDVSSAFNKNLGRREIVVVLEEQEVQGIQGRLTYLRLNSDGYRQNLSNYTALYSKHSRAQPGNKTIDFRIPHLAFIKEE